MEWEEVWEGEEIVDIRLEKLSGVHGNLIEDFNSENKLRKGLDKQKADSS